jgi:hypothetical protein
VSRRGRTGAQPDVPLSALDWKSLAQVKPDTFYRIYGGIEMDAAAVSGDTVLPASRVRLARASAWVGASAVVTWGLGAGAFLLALAIRDAPDQVMAAVVVSIGASLVLALAGIVLASAALLRHGGPSARVGLGLSLLGVLLVYLAPALGIVAGGLLS